MTSIALAVLAGASLGFLTWVDRAAWLLAAARTEQLGFVARFRITSFSVALLLYVIVERSRPFRLPARDTAWKPLARLATYWLSGCLVALQVVRVWTPTLRSAADYVAFLGTGLVAEELLFRGTLFRLASRVWNVPPRGVGLPVVVTAVLFALSHLQFHGFVVTVNALTQVAYTLGAGIVFGVLRSRSDSLWPPILLHLLTNSISVLRQ